MRNYNSNTLCKKESMKFFKTDIFNDNYQQFDNKAKNERKYLNNYVNGTLSSNISFMTPVNYLFSI